MRLVSPFTDEAYLVTGISEEKLGVFIKTTYPDYKGWVDGKALGRMEDPEKDGIKYHYIWIDPTMIKAEMRLTLVHEAIHLVTSIFEDCGIPISLANDETFAYVHGSFCEQLFKHYKL